MKCAEVNLNLGAFMLGGLEPEEADEIRRHLDSCSGCQNELRELEKVNQALGAAPPPADPPAYLKDGILAHVRGEGVPSSGKRFSTSRTFRLVLPAVATLVVAVALAVYLRSDSPVATVQLIPTPAMVEDERYWGVAELHPQPSGSQLVELKLNNLDEPEPRTFYEMWFVSGEKHVSAGTFTTVGSGETKVWLTAPPEARNCRTLLVTEEPATGDHTRSEEVILRGEVT